MSTGAGAAARWSGVEEWEVYGIRTNTIVCHDHSLPQGIPEMRVQIYIQLDGSRGSFHAYAPGTFIWHDMVLLFSSSEMMKRDLNYTSELMITENE